VPLTHTELVDQLNRIVEIRLLDPLEILLDGDAAVEALRTLLRHRVEAWARQMTGDDDRAAVGAVMRVMSTLYPGDGPFEPPVQWWSSPLGRVLVRRVGHPTAGSVPYPVAGAMLGITRQGVHDLVNRGKLERHPQGGVVPASIRARLLSEGS
jgi:hypothetical protein